MGKMKTATIGEVNNKNKEKSLNAHKGEEKKVHISGLKGGQRINVIESETPVEAVQTAGVSRVDKVKAEKIRSQKYKAVKGKIEAGKAYSTDAAIKLVKETSYSKFDGTMELHLMVKKTGATASVSLPFAAGRVKKVEVASDDTIEKLKKGVIDFDILVSTPDMMAKLVPFARLLGPRGMMPNPKNGTLVADPKKASAFSTSTVTLKTEKEAPLVHTVIGKNSQKDEEIAANLEAILKAFGGGKQVVRAFIKSSMSPSVRLNLN